MRKELAAFAERKLINPRQKKTISACAFFVAIIGVGVEAVGDRNTIVHFTRKGVRGIPLIVGLVDGKRVIRL